MIFSFSNSIGFKLKTTLASFRVLQLVVLSSEVRNEATSLHSTVLLARNGCEAQLAAPSKYGMSPERPTVS